MLVAEKQLHTTNSINIRPMCRADISRTKTFLNSLVEEANNTDFAVIFPELDRLLEEYGPVSCSHHLNSCVRTQDPRFEILSHMKAVETATRYNSDSVYFEVII